MTERMRWLERLTLHGFRVSVRIDPLFPGWPPQESRRDELVEKLRRLGVTHLTISFIFLRPHIRRRLEAIPQLSYLLQTKWVGGRIQGGGAMEVLPKHVRLQEVLDWHRRTKRHGVTICLCGCKNADLFGDPAMPSDVVRACGIAGHESRSASHVIPVRWGSRARRGTGRGPTSQMRHVEAGR